MPPPPPPRGVNARRLFRAVVLSTLAGFLVAMLALPSVGLLGLSAKDRADFFLDLPANLVAPHLPQRSVIVDAAGQPIAILSGEQDRVEVRLDVVPEVMRQAVIAIEDARFYDHSGLDYRSLVRAYLTNRETGEITQGGSTLTQQYVKNVLLLTALAEGDTEAERAATAQTIERKLREARHALYLEEHLSKDDILERYLNIAYFGDGAYGVQAAAEHYFRINVDQLSLPQAALLAGLVKNPTAFNPKLHPQAAEERRDVVLERMRELGYITPRELAEAKATDIVVDQTVRPADSCEAATYAPHVCAYVRDTLLADETFGETPDERKRLLFEGGLTIKTTLDPVAQGAAQSSVEEVIPVGNRVAAGVAVVEPGSGKILAMAVNRRYGSVADGLPADQSADFTHTKEVYPVVPDAFSPGSTFKVFALAAALERGLPLSTTYHSPTCYRSRVFNNPKPRDCYGNADPNEAGHFSLTTATWDSVNTYYVQLAEKIGVLEIAEMARRLGVSSCRVEEHRTVERCEGVDGVGRRDGAFTLGSNEVSTLDLATAYATLAAGGIRCDSKIISSITRKVGNAQRDVAHGTGRPCEQVIDRRIADTVSAVLQGVINHGTAAGNGRIGRPAAGKTGTAQSFSTASFAGYIPQLSAAVTLADPRGPTAHPLRNVLGSRVVYGGGFPTQIWARTMTRTIEGRQLPVLPLPTPDNTQPVLPTKKLPDVTGLPRPIAEDLLQREGFLYRVESVQAGAEPTGTVVATTPSPGSDVALGTEVVLHVAPGFSFVGPPGDAGPRPRSQDRVSTVGDSRP